VATRKYEIPGMRSAEDVQRVDQALRGVWGIQEVAAQPSSREVTFSYDERAAKEADFKQAILESGYDVKE
jgi:copper chaperone CopZ